MPNSLDASKLTQFAPKKPRKVTGGGELKPKEARKSAVPEQEIEPKGWPSREVRDGQLGLRGPIETLDEFKKLCKGERRSYVDMLQVLMNSYSSLEK